MKRSFKVAEFTSLDDIAQWAAVDPADEIELRVTAASGLVPTVEGVVRQSSIPAKSSWGA